MSGNIDFWTDPHRRESFGAFVLDLLASKYVMDDGMTLFMSQETRDKVDDDLFQTGTPILDNLEFPVNFECFPGSKTLLCLIGCLNVLARPRLRVMTSTS